MLPGENICCFIGLLKIKEAKYCSVCCHALELSNFLAILNSKAQVDCILAEYIATM
jgi:hypothetical protein